MVKSKVKNNKKITQKNAKIVEKKAKKAQKREFLSLLEGDKLSKNVISVRKNLKHKNIELEKDNNRRIKKCYKILADTIDYDENFEIVKKINEFNSNEKKTIVYFIDSFYPSIDGVVSVLENYATLLKDRYNIVVCAPKHNNYCTPIDRYFVLYSDSLYIKTQGYDLGFPQVDAMFQHYISMLKIDLIHVQSPFNMGSYGVALAKRRKVPCFATFHSQLKRNFYNAVKSEAIATWLTKVTMNVYKQADVVLTMNEFTKSLIGEYGLHRPVEILPNATNLVPKEFDPKYESGLLKKFGIDNSLFNILFIGRLVEVKNVYLILKIIEKLHLINKKFRMIFLGYGPEQAKMKKIVKDKGLSDVIIFTGKIESSDEKAVIIKNSNLLFFPSDYDTDGIVKIECACYNVPTLCLENTGVSSNLKNNVTGFTEPKDETALKNRLDYLINNPKIVNEVGQNAHDEIYVTWQQVCDKLDEYYKKYLKNFYIKSKKSTKIKRMLNKTTRNTKPKNKAKLSIKAQ